jgi:hypothetical protein
MRSLITAAAVLATLDPGLADGLRAGPRQYPLPPPPQPSQSCLMTALQLDYQTGRRVRLRTRISKATKEGFDHV